MSFIEGPVLSALIDGVRLFDALFVNLQTRSENRRVFRALPSHFAEKRLRFSKTRRDLSPCDAGKLTQRQRVSVRVVPAVSAVVVLQLTRRIGRVGGSREVAWGREVVVRKEDTACGVSSGLLTRLLLRAVSDAVDCVCAHDSWKYGSRSPTRPHGSNRSALPATDAAYDFSLLNLVRSRD